MLDWWIHPQCRKYQWLRFSSCCFFLGAAWCLYLLKGTSPAAFKQISPLLFKLDIFELLIHDLSSCLQVPEELQVSHCRMSQQSDVSAVQRCEYSSWTAGCSITTLCKETRWLQWTIMKNLYFSWWTKFIFRISNTKEAQLSALPECSPDSTCIYDVMPSLISRKCLHFCSS